MARKPAARSSGKTEPAPRATPVVEWITAGVGLVLVLGALAVVLFSALQPRTPPALELAASRIMPSTAGWMVEVEVSNAGSETAAAVEIEGVLGAETAGATLDYVPGHGTETATLIFSVNPSAAGLILRVRGWTRP